MPANKCIFQKGWLLKYPWGVDNADSKVKASCKVCRTDIDITSMGESALKSHQKSANFNGTQGLTNVMEFLVFLMVTTETYIQVFCVARSKCYFLFSRIVCEVII